MAGRLPKDSAPSVFVGRTDNALGHTVTQFARH